MSAASNGRERELRGRGLRDRGARFSEAQVRNVLIALIALVPLVVALLAYLDGWEVLGDNAIIGIRVQNLLRGDLPLTGLPSTGENFGSGVVSNHPGPLSLYLLAPFVFAFGPTAGLALGAAAINAASFGFAAWAGYRRGGVFLTGIIGVVLCLLATSLSPWTLVDPLSSNLGTFPSVAFALLAWAVLAGDRRLLPVAMVVGTFTVQAHLTYIGFGAGVAAVLLIGLVVQGVRDRRSIPEPVTLWVTGGLLGLLWLPVLVDQFAESGNLSSIVRTFTSDGAPGSGWSFALERLARTISVPPFIAERVTGLDFLSEASMLSVAVGVAVALATGFQVYRSVRRGDRVLPAFAAVVLGVAAVSLYSAAQLPSGATVKAANLRWMWTVGALFWLLAVWALVSFLLERAPRPRPVRVVPVLLAAVVLAAGFVVVQAERTPARDARAFEVAAELREAADRLPNGTYQVRYSGEKALLTVGPSFAYALRSAGSTVYVDAGPYGRGYGDEAIFAGQAVDEVLLVATAPKGELGLPPNYEELLHTSYVENGQVVETYLGRKAEEDVTPEDISGFCGNTEELSQEIGRFARSVASGTTVTGAQAALLLGSLDIASLEREVPQALQDAAQKAKAGYPAMIEALEAAGDSPALEAIDPEMVSALQVLVDFWLRNCN